MRPATLDSVTFLVVLPGPAHCSVAVALGVGDETPVDGVGDAPFQRSECFFVGLAFVEFLVVVDAAWCLVADLGDGGGVDRVVEDPVPSP